MQTHSSFVSPRPPHGQRFIVATSRKRAGKSARPPTRNGDDPVFERLPQRFEHRAGELGQLVEQQDTAVREADLTRSRHGTPADHGRRGRTVVLGSFIGVTALVMISLVNLVAPLPPNIQRSLSFLPGTWDQRIRDDANESTDWRVEMWIEVLSSDRYIHDKILGDGLGFSASVDGDTVLYRSLTDVYPGAQRLTIRRVGIVANWEWGSDTGSVFHRFVARS